MSWVLADLRLQAPRNHRAKEVEMTAATQTSQTPYAGPPFEEARVYDAMRVGVVTCRPETSLHDVARMMVTYKIHAVVVQAVGPGTHPWGIVSSLDIAGASGTDLYEHEAQDVATTDLVTVPANETLRHAAKLMAEHGITHLIVVEAATDWPCGMISARDLAAVLTAPPASMFEKYGAAAVSQSD
jgi:CBS domain-containing protein